MTLAKIEPPTGADWAAVAHDYAAGELTVAALCALHGVSKSALYRQAEIDGWAKRAPHRKRRRLVPRPLPNTGKRIRSKTLARRLLLALDHKMTDFETRIADGPATASDSERDARTLNTLVRLFEKLERFTGKRGSRTTAPAGSAATTKDTDDADRLRGELARRLETLRGQFGG